MMTKSRKIALSTIISLLIILLGVAYQFYYLEERSEYEKAIRIHYLKIFGKEPGDKELRHLSTLALNRYGPTESYRNERDYEQLFEREGT